MEECCDGNDVDARMKTILGYTWVIFIIVITIVNGKLLGFIMLMNGTIVMLCNSD